MTNTKDVILKLKEVKEEKGLSLDKILILMEKNGQFLSKSTLSRVFAKGSEEKSFRYEETLRPIANVLLDIETIEADDDPETKAYKSILKYKMKVIDENSKKITELTDEMASIKADADEKVSREKQKYQQKLAAEMAKFQKSLDFAMHQIELKDQRITQLLDANIQLLNQLLSCPCRQNNEIGAQK